MIRLLKYLPVIIGVVRFMKTDPRVRKAYGKAKARRSTGSTQRR